MCRQLGFSPYGQFFVCVEWSDPHAVLTGAIGPTSMDQTSGVTRYINDLNCTGSESRLLHCPYNGITNYTCPSNKRDANVYCQGKNGVSLYATSHYAFYSANNVITDESNCTDGEVRLVGGSTKYEGRVEVCINRAWGTVCGYSNGWGQQEASVVCRQVGAMRYGATYDLVGRLGLTRGSGPILMGFLTCSGAESNLTECSQHYSYTHYYCTSHYYDAGVICQGMWYYYATTLFLYLHCCSSV